MLVVGDREQEANAVRLRRRHEGDLGSVAVDDVVARLSEEAAAILDRVEHE
jgi:threonyl-tRNA synthetase